MILGILALYYLSEGDLRAGYLFTLALVLTHGALAGGICIQAFLKSAQHAQLD